MNDDRKLVLAQKKARLKEEQKRAEIQQFKDHFAKNIEHFSQKYRYADEDVEREGFFPHRKGFDVPKRNQEFIECFRDYLQKQQANGLSY